VQEGGKPGFPPELGSQLDDQALDQDAMLGDGKGVRAFGLSVPAGDTRQTMGDVLDLDVERRGIEQVQTPAAQHALPGALVCFFDHGEFVNSADEFTLSRFIA